MVKIGFDVRLLLLLSIPVAVLMLLHYFVTGFVVYNDGRGYYMYLHSAVIDHDINFTNEWDYYNTTYSRFSSAPIAINVPPDKTAMGIPDNIYLIGNAVMWLPFFLASHLAALVLSQLGMAVVADGFGVLYDAGIGLASFVYGLAGIWLIYRFCRKWHSYRVSLMASILVWYGTSAFWFHAVEPSMAHMNSLFLGAVFATFWYDTIGKRTLFQWALLGMLLGLIYLVRQQDILFGLLPILEVARAGLHGAWKSVKGLAFFGMGALAAVVPQMLVWRSLYGKFLVYSYAGTQKYWHWTFPQLIPFFLSPEAGMWRVPALLVSLIGLLAFARKVKGVAWYFVALVVFEVLVTSAWSGWNVGYGIRFLLGMSVFLALGCAEFLRKFELKFGSKAAFALIFALVLANFVNMTLVMLKEVTSKVPLSEFPNLIRSLL